MAAQAAKAAEIAKAAQAAKAAEAEKRRQQETLAAASTSLKACMMCHKGSPGPKFSAVKAAYTDAYGDGAKAKLVAFLTDIRDNGKNATTPATVAKYAHKIKTMRKQGKKIKKATPEAAALAIMGM